jgi:hypothetical protein
MPFVEAGADALPAHFLETGRLELSSSAEMLDALSGAGSVAASLW